MFQQSFYQVGHPYIVQGGIGKFCFTELDNGKCLKGRKGRDHSCGRLVATEGVVYLGKMSNWLLMRDAREQSAAAPPV